MQKEAKKPHCISVWHKTFQLSHQFVQKEARFPFPTSVALTMKILAKQSIFVFRFAVKKSQTYVDRSVRHGINKEWT